MMESPAASPAVDLAARVDRYGRKFDALKFLPVFDKAGRWKNRNAGRKKATMTTPDQTNAPVPAASEAAPPPPAESDRPAPDLSDIAAAARPPVASATETAQSFDLEGLEGVPTVETLINAVQLALILIGEDEGVLTDMEKRLLRRPLERVLKKYNVGDSLLGPEADLALVVAGLVISRAQKPKTATFIAKAKAWCVNLWFRSKGEVLRREVARAVS